LEHIKNYTFSMAHSVASSNASFREAKCMTRPVGIDLFAGAGGLSLGFEQAGFDVKAAVEIDPVHCAVHKFNFPDTAVISRSIAKLTGADIRLATGLGRKDIDCVFGGPPCQGFSMIGKRALDDPRNALALDFVRLVAELDARTFVFENVKGLTVGRHQAFLNELIAAFEAKGYEVTAPWAVLNAANFGVPQSRERLILMGAKKGAKLPNYPTATTNIVGSRKQISGLPNGPTCAEAIGDLPDVENFDALLRSDSVLTNGFGTPSTYAAELRCLTDDAWHRGLLRDWRPALLTSSARTDHSKISRRRFAETEPGTVEPISRFYRLSADGISNTLRAGTDGARGAFTSPRPIHYALSRCVTVREMARLHGFPDWFRLHVTKWHGARQIGNAVAPPLARAIGISVMTALGYKPQKQYKVISLGDPALLQMQLVKASEYFGVEAPSARRDKKSGATKRKQSEIEILRVAGLRVANG
jgi:DNA (cytosine-5)-methyltransferase 1